MLLFMFLLWDAKKRMVYNFLFHAPLRCFSNIKLVYDYANCITSASSSLSSSKDNEGTHSAISSNPSSAFLLILDTESAYRMNSSEFSKIIIFYINLPFKNTWILLPDMLYYRHKKINRPQSRLTKYQNRKSTPTLAKVYRSGFSMYGYLQNVKINVSNAKRNIPNVSNSIKETLILLFFLCFLFFIGITPILLKWKVSPPCNTIDF